MARAPLVQDIEAAPEADRLDGAPHPRATATLFGHAGAEEMLAEAVRGGRMHHGWLLTGREGIGKATLAYGLARHLLAEPAERDPFGLSLAVGETTRAFRQVLALSHPGLLVIRRPWDSKAKRHAAAITVDEVRRLRMFLAHSADAGAWRAVIVDSADDLNVNAANALLKSLEEPPARTVFLLVSSEPGRLLATIRSRCRTLDLATLAPPDLQRAVAAACAASGKPPPDAIEWPRLVELAQGSPRRALAIAGSGALQLYARILALVAALPRVDWQAVHALADEIAPGAAEQKFVACFDLLLDLVARLVRAAATGAGSAADHALAVKLMPGGDASAFAEAWEQIVADKAATAAINLDKRALLLAAVGRLEAAARL